MIAKRRIAGILLAGAVCAGGVATMNRDDEAGAQSGLLEAGTLVAIGAELVNHAKEAVQNHGSAILYATAETRGPDADDLSTSYDVERESGLDWTLEVKAQASNENAADDGQESPYTRGEGHSAVIEIGYEAESHLFGSATWTPKIIRGTRPQREYGGGVLASPEDDPVAGAAAVETSAATAGAFASDGNTKPFCYVAAAVPTTSARGAQNVRRDRECTGSPAGSASTSARAAAAKSPSASWSLKFGVMLFAAPGRFSFTETSGGVRVEPLFEREIDLVHTYLQRRGNDVILPLEKGSRNLLDIRKRLYADRAKAKGRPRLITRGSKRADLTLIGARLKLEPKVVAKGTHQEMLRRYFDEGVKVVAPRHAQRGYRPRVVAAGVVAGGEDASRLAGREYRLPDLSIHGIGHTPKDDSEQAVGVFIAVKGDVTRAVRLAARTRGSFVYRALRTEARRRQARARRARASQAGGPRVRFKLSGMSFHHEAGLFMDDRDTASAPPTTFHELSVVHSGDGTGTTTSNPSGIGCPDDCKESYPAGTMVTLTATPAAGAAFDGWSGACTGTGSCVVTMDAAKSVTANYRTVRHELTVTIGGDGAGQVTSQPAGIACPGDCTEPYVEGTKVTLTATPSGGSEFVQWTGDCTGFTPTCEVTMSQARNVTAEFAGGGLANLSVLRAPSLG